VLIANCYHTQSNHFFFIVYKQLNYLLGPLSINNYIFSALNRPGLFSFEVSCLSNRDNRSGTIDLIPSVHRRRRGGHTHAIWSYQDKSGIYPRYFGNIPAYLKMKIFFHT